MFEYNTGDDNDYKTMKQINAKIGVDFEMQMQREKMRWIHKAPVNDIGLLSEHLRHFPALSDCETFHNCSVLFNNFNLLCYDDFRCQMKSVNLEIAKFDAALIVTSIMLLRPELSKMQFLYG